MTRFSLLLLAGCYGTAPSQPPRVPLPPIVPDQEVVVTSETSTNIETVSKKSWTCPQGHLEGSPQCSYTTIPMQEPVTRTTTTATYGGVELTDPQLRVMADERHEAKRVELEALSARCRGANTPRLIGIAGVVGGLVLWGVAAATKEPAFTYAGFGAFGIGIGSYTYGYFVAGGSSCKEAQLLASDLSGDRILTAKSRADEVRELAAKFNAHNRRISRSAGSTP